MARSSASSRLVWAKRIASVPRYVAGRRDTVQRRGAAVAGGLRSSESDSCGCVYLLGRRAGVPVVAGASSGIQVIASRSYLNPFAAFSASFVEFITRYH